MNSSTQFYASPDEIVKFLLSSGKTFHFELLAYNSASSPPAVSDVPPYSKEIVDFMLKEACNVVIETSLRHPTVEDVYRHSKNGLICTLGAFKEGVLIESQLFTRTETKAHPFRQVQTALRRLLRRGSWLEGADCREYYPSQLYSNGAKRMCLDGIRLSQSNSSNAPFLNLTLEPPEKLAGRCIQDLIEDKWIDRRK